MIIFLLSLELFRRRCNVAWSISAVVVFDILYGHHEFTPNKDFFVSAQRWKLVNWTKPNITLMTFLKKTHDWQWKQVASWHQGCTSCGSLAARKRRENEKMEREWENEERMRKWRGNEERFALYISSFSLHSLSIHFLCQKLSHLVAKCWIRHFCRECHKKLIIRAVRKWFWVEFAARKLRRPAWHYSKQNNTAHRED